jgi:hypothetical protein
VDAPSIEKSSAQVPTISANIYLDVDIDNGPSVLLLGTRNCDVQDTQAVRGFVSRDPHRSHAALAGVKFARRIRDQAGVQPPPHRSDQHHAKKNWQEICAMTMHWTNGMSPGSCIEWHGWLTTRQQNQEGRCCLGMTKHTGQRVARGCSLLAHLMQV